MIIAYTGLPGGGKSLSAIQDYVLPQLGKGRHLFCNIAGLNPMLIACRLGVTTPGVESLLHRFSLFFSDDQAAASKRFKAELEDGSSEYFNSEGMDMLVSDAMRHREAVLLLDECHEYLGAENYRNLGSFRKYLSMARHYGHDVILITQHIRDIWEPLRERVHETHDFTRGKLGFRSQYKEAVYHGWNVYAEPGYVRQRRNDKTLYPLYSSHDGGAKEHMGYISMWQSGKVRLALCFSVFIFFFAFWHYTHGSVFAVAAAQSAALAPAPEHRADENAIYVKYVVCGAVDCKATRPDGSVLTLPLDYASGKYPLEVRKYAPNPNPSLVGSALPGQ